MTTFEMVKYHNKEYPLQIPLRIEEVAAHFDIQKISPTGTNVDGVYCNKGDRITKDLPCDH